MQINRALNIRRNPIPFEAAVSFAMKKILNVYRRTPANVGNSVGQCDRWRLRKRLRKEAEKVRGAPGLVVFFGLKFGIPPIFFKFHAKIQQKS